MESKEELIIKAKALLAESNVSAEGQSLWISRFEHVNTTALSLFLKVFAEDKELLGLATENLGKKLEAGDDPEKIKKLMEEEKAMLLLASLKG